MGPRELRVGSQALCADFRARQGVCNRSLRHVGLLVGLIGGVGQNGEQVHASDSLLSALVVKRGVGNAHSALAWPFWSWVDDFALASLLGQDGEGAMPSVVGVIGIVG